MLPIDGTNIFQFLGVLGVGGLLMEIVRWILSRGQRQDETATKLRDELTHRYDDASKDLRELRSEIDELWEARREDRIYIEELEDFVARLIQVLNEHKISPIPTRPVRRRGGKERGG